MKTDGQPVSPAPDGSTNPERHPEMRETATTSGAGFTLRESRGKAAVPAAQRPDGRTPPVQPQRGRLTVYLAALAALAAIPIHMYWALGGTWGLPGGAATAGLPGIRATNIAVSVLLACGAAYLYGLTRPWTRRPPALLMLAPVWAASVVCISHGLFGIVTKGLYVAGMHAAVSWPEHDLTAAQKNVAALRDLAAFEPWFLIQGLLLVLAGRWLARTPTERRRWTLSLVAGIVLVDAFGIVLAVTHHHFAVS
jgi:Protein of unknown function (DUF3995)